MTIRRRTGRSSFRPSIGEPVSRGYLVFTDWHQNRLTCPFLVLCVHFTTIAARKSPRCTSASAWKLEHRQRSPALAFSSSIPFSRSTESRGRMRPNSTETHILGCRRSDAHQQKLPGASPAAVVPTSGGLRFEAECQPIGDFAVRQTRGLDLRAAPKCVSPPQRRRDKLPRPSTDANSALRESWGAGPKQLIALLAAAYQ